MEAALLGQWIVADPEFLQQIDSYLRSYLAWLDADPDVAAWSDIAIVVGLEADGSTLTQEPDAVLISPFHPLHLAWQSSHSVPCSRPLIATHRVRRQVFSDPDSVPDALVLSLRTAGGAIKRQVFFSVECSSDYWSILWNGSRLDQLAKRAGDSPFDQEFGIQIGGIAEWIQLCTSGTCP